MGLKQKLGMGVASAALGLSLIGGGTVAYFSDSVETNNTFAAGTLDLSVNPTTLVNVSKIKPGDTILKEFKLKNNGTLKIENVHLLTDYTVTDANGDNGEEDFGKHIKVSFIWNWDKQSEVVYETTLADLKEMTPDLVAEVLEETSPEWAEEGGLQPKKNDYLWVQFEFVDNGEDQNMFQGDQLDLKWTFEATQAAGDER